MSLLSIIAIKFAWSRKGGWRLSCSPVMGMTVTEERLKQRRFISFKDYYHHVRQKSVVSLSLITKSVPVVFTKSVPADIKLIEIIELG
jgi:hypothetical protein